MRYQCTVTEVTGNAREGLVFGQTFTIAHAGDYMGAVGLLVLWREYAEDNRALTHVIDTQPDLPKVWNTENEEVGVQQLTTAKEKADAPYVMRRPAVKHRAPIAKPPAQKKQKEVDDGFDFDEDEEEEVEEEEGEEEFELA